MSYLTSTGLANVIVIDNIRGLIVADVSVILVLVFLLLL